MNSHFGELRSLAQRAPEPDSWAQLCALLDRAPVHERLEVLVPYLEDTLVTWPDAVRAVAPTWLERLVDGERVPELAIARTLDLRITFTGARVVEALGSSDQLGHLTQLYASGKRLGPAGILALLSRGALGALEVLHLDDASLSDDGARALGALADRGVLRGVRELSVADNAIGPDGIRDLCVGDWENLSDLDVSSNHVGNPGLESLVGSGVASRLDAFSMSYDRGRVAPRGLRALEGDAWAGLRELVLAGAYSQPRLAESLARSPALASLEVLGLNWNLVGCNGATILFEGRRFERLRELDLRRNLLRDDGAIALAQGSFPALERVRLEHNLIGSAGRDALERTLAERSVRVEV